MAAAATLDLSNAQVKEVVRQHLENISPDEAMALFLRHLRSLHYDNGVDMTHFHSQVGKLLPKKPRKSDGDVHVDDQFPEGRMS